MFSLKNAILPKNAVLPPTFSKSNETLLLIKAEACSQRVPQDMAAAVVGEIKKEGCVTW